MKRIAIIIAILLIASTSFAMGKRHGGNNLHMFGSDDSKGNKHVNTTSIPPTVPVPVPEPSTIILIGAGLLGLAWIKRK